jgi:tetraacyldisaccharide 4'-kinase
MHATVAWHRQFPDHHRYRPEDWQAVVTAALRSRPDAVLTTEKDWVRLEAVARGGSVAAAPLWVLGVRMQLLSGENDLDARLALVCAR